ncbi:MAG TPA: carboxypeptidase regulatory-like domain-containing protein [Thermoanaerobaculia bacterium]|jgi:outer membrane receptor protein involved in Fe transport|nr:carboxypeptidase regulatory-like domain-containing protein [Thermoanaerobaculia bacterium]
MKLQRFTICFFLLLLVAAGAFAQGTTGALTGTVTQAGSKLPGVTVTIASPKMQGTRSTVTNEQGDYSFPSIPPGVYKVTFSLSGLTDVVKSAQVNLVETSRQDADMKVAAVTEAITVTASQPTVMETPQVQTNFKQTAVNQLPMARNPAAQAALSPGVTNGVNGNTISGAMSYDNLYLVNGAVVNENLRGQPHALYIEDAIQETTVLTGGISAEFGRFTGGVVSSVTKSGGNEFSGSVRDSLDNPKWTALSISTQQPPVDHTNNTYEETFGGRIIRDRLWFFVASRQAKLQSAANLVAVSTLPNPAIGSYTITQSQPRDEYKATANITEKHSIVGSYLTNNIKGDKNCQIGCLDLRSINENGVVNPNNFKTLHYNGVITNNFLLEGDWAKKYFAFVGFGGSTPAHQSNPTAAYFAEGSPVLDQLVTGVTANAPYFCGSCGPELRNNKEWELKGRYFLGTKSLGTHNIVAGYDDWAEQRLSNNYQSPTDFRYDIRSNVPKQLADGTVQISLGPTDRFVWFPIALASLGSNLATKSEFINDKWDLNQHFTFNLGGRYDKNDAVDSAGHGISKDSAFSPRLGAIFDVFGNGRLRLDANYGEYVGRLAETVSGGGSAAGNPATYQFVYGGPTTPYEDSRVALQTAFQWFLDNGFTSRTPFSTSIPGFNTFLQNSGITSPNMREVTVGAGTQIGKGFFRADYIHRDWRDFYATLDVAGNTVVNPATGALANLNIIGNSNVPDRQYWGAQFQGQYTLPAGFGVGGNYTYSKLTGNVEGETSGSGPVTFGSTSVAFKEFQNFAQNQPDGYLAADQRHKLRIWGTYDLGTRIGHFNLGVIERYDSGTPFSAAGTITVTPQMLCSNGSTPASGNALNNASVALCQTGSNIYPDGSPRDPAHQYAAISGTQVGLGTVNYFFSPRGAYRWNSVISTDVALNYELPVHSFAFFAKAEIRNALNHQANISGNTTVFTNQNGGHGLLAFNPFTQSPIQCPTNASAATCTALGANYQLGPTFGQSTGSATTFAQNGNYQLPRTYLYSVGMRF